MIKPLGIALLACVVCLHTPLSLAQDDSENIGSSFKRLSADEEKRLRDRLATPVPEGATKAVLEKHFNEKRAAALQLAEPGMAEAAVRQEIQWLPSAAAKNNLARIVLGKGQFEEGNALMQEVIASAEPVNAAFYSANAACDLLDQNKIEPARKAFDASMARIAELRKTNLQGWQPRMVERAAHQTMLCTSRLEQRMGRFGLSIDAAEQSEKFARKAWELTRPNESAAARANSQAEIAKAIARKLESYRHAGRLQDAERTLGDYLRISNELQLPATYQSGMYSVAGNIRFSQREFQQAEALHKKSDAILEGLGYSTTDNLRLERAGGVVGALLGQKRWADAQQKLDELDTLAGNDAKIKSKIRLGFERATSHFGNGRYALAAPLFRQLGMQNAQLHGASHFFAAQSFGMEGASLWRTGIADNKTKALPLLKNAVRDYLAAPNADYLENIRMRKEYRDWVFAAYLEAVTTTSGEDPMQALGPADWVRGGSTQEALNDAAVRAAATTPALAQVVRSEQDAKNEIAGLRAYLSGAAGDANSTMPAIAQQMRIRISELEAVRAKLQAEIKTRFPDYATLVQPTALVASDLAKQLSSDQALVMLLPTAEAVYVWALAADKPPSFVRAAVSESQLTAMVTALRRDLDFAGRTRAPNRYDSAIAYALYEKLLQPVASTWGTKPQLVIAAGGVLSQLPFAVLHTQPGGKFDAKAPWLVAQAAIAQVPSLSAWSAIKNISKSKPASEAFIGWADPLFAATSPASPGKAGAVRQIAITRAAAFADLRVTDATRNTPALRYSAIPPLPETRDELIEIAQTLQSASTDVITGERATRESVLKASTSGLLANRRVIAFATHGLMAGDLPNLTQPALALAAGNADANNPLSPLLTLEDVLTLKLNADWVVLSACNTAAADGKAEEALSGLARGFFYAGSRSLLVTHWAVESESAKQLTTATFAHYVANPQAPKAESLRQAMLKVMAQPQFAHPAYWAPYALVGDGGR